MADDGDSPVESGTIWDSDPTDGRADYDWKSKYTGDARKIIRHEACYLLALFFGCLILLFLVWCNFFESYLNVCCSKANYSEFKHFSYFALGGLLGGLVFGFKYLFHVVSRGRWHEDRRVWRYVSPYMSLAVAFIVGLLFDSGIGGEVANLNGSAGELVSSGDVSDTSSIAVGFLAGYFSDKAIAKMQEVASIIFGSTEKSSTPN